MALQGKKQRNKNHMTNVNFGIFFSSLSTGVHSRAIFSFNFEWLMFVCYSSFFFFLVVLPEP
jgi:hypothetical protein